MRGTINNCNLKDYCAGKGGSMLKQQSDGRADLHVHTTASDGLASVQTLLDYVARHRQLDVIAITDHDTLDASLWAVEQHDAYPFDIVPGMEVTTAQGHVLALWVTQPIPRDLSIAETAAAIHEQGGVAVLAHPFHIQLDFVRAYNHLYRRRPQILLEWGLDAVEAHNAAGVVPLCNWYTRQVFGAVGLAQLGNSDAHTPGAVGSGWTRFAGKTAADLRRAIQTRTTQSQGGFWHPAEYFQFVKAWRSGSLGIAEPRLERL